MLRMVPLPRKRGRITSGEGRREDALIALRIPDGEIPVAESAGRRGGVAEGIVFAVVAAVPGGLSLGLRGAGGAFLLGGLWCSLFGETIALRRRRRAHRVDRRHRLDRRLARPFLELKL